MKRPHTLFSFVRPTLVAALALAAPALSTPVAAQDYLEGQDTTLEILPGWVEADGTYVAALSIVLPKGWKTYWRAPGDAGIPPTIRWSGSGNLGALVPHWPTPEVFSQNDMRSVGYHDQVIVPIVLTPRRPGAPIRLRGKIDIGVCKEVCMPATLRFDQKLSADTLLPQVDERIVDAMEDQPISAEQAGLSAISCTLAPTDDGLRLRAELRLPNTGSGEFTVVETADPQIWVAEASTTRHGSVLTVETEMMHMESDSFALDRSGLRFTVLGSDRAVDIQGCSTS